MVCDFGKIDAEIHLVLANKLDFSPFEPIPKYTKGFQDLSLGATSFSQYGPKYFFPIPAIHQLTKKQLDVTLASVQRSKHTTDEVKFKISIRIMWLFEVRKFWWIVIKFLKMQKRRK